MNVSIADLIWLDYLMGESLEDAHEDEEDLSKYKILSPTPKGRKVYSAACGNDTHTASYVTKGAGYTDLTPYIQSYFITIIDDSGYIREYNRDWFQEVTLYDEDEDDLICRDIEFEEGDYIDFRKHTPDQIRHIAKFYPVYDIEGVLSNSKWHYLFWKANTCDITQFDSCQILSRCTGKEYTYDDIFYNED